MELNILYQDQDFLVVNKPAGLTVFPENEAISEKTLIDYLIEKFPEIKNAGKAPRYGIIHRLDKDTSGILLVAKNSQTLEFFQKQFQDNKVEKKYLALVVGQVKNDSGRIETLIGRAPSDRRKQKVYLAGQPKAENKREAITEYKTVEKFKDYTLLEVLPKTGRKHQIRTHLAYLGHPIVKDPLYGFKNQPEPEGLTRQFLHAFSLKIATPKGEEKEFRSDLPTELKNAIKNI